MLQRWVMWLLRNVVLNIFFLIFILIGFGYVFLIYFTPISVERLQLLISIDAVAATLAGLLFYASYASKDETRKTVYFQCAEKFLHCFVLLFVVAFLRGSLLLIDDFSWYANWRPFIAGIIKFIATIFFAVGFTYYLVGLKKILVFIIDLNCKK